MTRKVKMKKASLLILVSFFVFGWLWANTAYGRGDDKCPDGYVNLAALGGGRACFIWVDDNPKNTDQAMRHGNWVPSIGNIIPSEIILSENYKGKIFIGDKQIWPEKEETTTIWIDYFNRAPGITFKKGLRSDGVMVWKGRGDWTGIKSQ